MKKVFLLLFLIPWIEVNAQISINTDGSLPDVSAMMDVKSTAKGLLIPRIALTGTGDVTTIPSPANSLMIYNTATAGSLPNNVTPGYYYWNGTSWTRFITGSASSNDWTLTGVAGTVDGIHFIGTTDDVPFNIRVNNQKAGRVASTGPVLLGYQAGNSNSGLYNTGVGYQSLFSNTTGNNNTILGRLALFSNISGSYNTAMGNSSLYLSTGGYNTAFGYQAGNIITTGINNTLIGYDADVSSNNCSNATAIGSGAIATSSNQVRLGNAGVTSLFCQGVYAATSANVPNVFVDANGQIFRSTGTGSSNWLITGNSGTVDGTNFIGTTDDVPFNIRVNNQKAGRVASNGPVFLGFQAGNINTATNNTGIGYQSLLSNSTGICNTAVGYQSLPSNSTGIRNTAFGYKTLFYNNGGYNTALGYQAGDIITTGTYNTCLGYDADLSSNNYTNSTAIGNGAIANGSNQVRLGNSNIISLFCQGAYASTSANSPNMYVDENGQIMRSTSALGATEWLLTGNSGTIDGTHFIGTTDDVPLNIRINNQKAGRVASYGPVFFGYQAGNTNAASDNTGVGYKSLYSNTTGDKNTSYGYRSLFSNITGGSNTACGSSALYSNLTGTNNTAVGNNSLYSNNEGFNTAIGVLAGYIITTGTYNTCIGYAADLNYNGFTNATAIGNGAKATASNQVRLGNADISSLFCKGAYASSTTNAPNLYVTIDGQIMRSTGSVGGSDWLLTGNYGSMDDTQFIGTTNDVPFNIKVNNQKAGRIASNGQAFFGYQAGIVNTASSNTGVGHQSLYSNTTGDYNTASGKLALYSNIIGNHNTAIGSNSLIISKAGYNTAIGSLAGDFITTGFNNTCIGYDADLTMNDFNNATAIGSGAQATASNQVRLGNSEITSFYCMGAYTATSANSPNLCVDANGQITRSTSFSNWFLTGNSGTVDGTNFIGTTDDVPFNIRVNNQKAGRVASTGPVFLGYQAGNMNIANSNTGVGYQSLSSNTSGNYNTAAGKYALTSNTTGNYNTAIGSRSLYNSTAGNNTALGHQAGYAITTGTQNTCIGTNSDVSENNLTNATAIGYGAIATANHQVRLGNSSVASLFCQGAYTSTATEAANVYVDNNGQIMRSTIGITDWRLTGNAGTIDGTNFVGTTDNVPFNIRVNNQKAGRVASTGPVFLGYQAGNSNTALNNTGVGFQALFSNTTANRNIAFGNNALYTQSYNNGGVEWNSDNVAIGFEALYFNQPTTDINGYNNTAVGNFALRANTTGFMNTASGMSSLASNTIGSYNTANGMSALSSNTTGNCNTAIGYFALNSCNAGNNTALGYHAGENISSGNYNTCLGNSADVAMNNFTNSSALGNGATASTSNQVRLGNSSITSLYCQGAYAATSSNAPNVYVNSSGQIMRSTGTTGGTNWLLSGNTGDGNDFIGTINDLPFNMRVNNQKAGSIASTGPVFLGYQAGNSNAGSHNAGIGYQALYINTSGDDNTASGYKALSLNSTGSSNTANGAYALTANTTGENNIAIGKWALPYNTSGSNNTANGYMALFTNSTAGKNIAIGNSALTAQSYDNGGTEWNSNNIAIGFEALTLNQPISSSTGIYNTAVGNLALRSNSHGHHNTACGGFALYSNTTGEFNSAFGYVAGAFGSAEVSNTTALGYGCVITASNQVRVGNSLITSIGGYEDWTTISDARFKTDVQEKVPGLDFILKLRPVTYHMDMEALASFLHTPDSLRNREGETAKAGILKTGFIAQEVEQAASLVGYDFSGVDKPKNENDYYGLRYAEFVVPLVKAAQEQQALIENLQRQNIELQKQIDELKNR